MADHRGDGDRLWWPEHHQLEFDLSKMADTDWLARLAGDQMLRLLVQKVLVLQDRAEELEKAHGVR